jgi:3-methyl-2-oxobutanoate hydroxymethyltransferase
MSTAFDAGNGKITVPDIVSRKTSIRLGSNHPSFNQGSNPYPASSGSNGRKIVCLTAYDYPTARIMDEAGVDVVLVGDSLGMVVLGYENTLPLTVEEMLHHTRAVRRGVRKALLVADMPYGSFHGDKHEAVGNAVRFVKEAGAEAVKVEGGERRMELIAQLVEAEIPVMGHIGLTPQSMHAFGGFRVQGKTVEAAEQLLRDARAVEAAGAFSIVLESIPRELAGRITSELRIPTIGIGAGPECDGQILVLHDMIGLSLGHTPKFTRRYANVGEAISHAVTAYAEDVQQGRFPADEESYHLSSEVRERLLAVRRS